MNDTALTVTPLRAVARDGWQKGTNARRDGRMNDRREGGREEDRGVMLS